MQPLVVLVWETSQQAYVAHALSGHCYADGNRTCDDNVTLETEVSSVKIIIKTYEIKYGRTKITEVIHSSVGLNSYFKSKPNYLHRIRIVRPNEVFIGIDKKSLRPTATVAAVVPRSSWQMLPNLPGCHEFTRDSINCYHDDDADVVLLSNLLWSVFREVYFQISWFWYALYNRSLGGNLLLLALLCVFYWLLDNVIFRKFKSRE